MDTKDDYKDLEGLAFEHSAENPRGRQEREQYRKGLRRNISGEISIDVNNKTRHSEYR